MRMDKLTNQLQLALAEAQSLALGQDHNFIEPVHLLSALIEQSERSTFAPLSGHLFVTGLTDNPSEHAT